MYIPTLTNKPYHHEQITVSTVKSLTPGTPPSGRSPVEAVLSVQTDAIMMRFDGTDPTASAGIYVAANATANITGEAAIRALKMIKVTNNATVDVAYFY